jgi:ribosomal protein S2
MKLTKKYQLSLKILTENLVHLGYPESERHYTNTSNIVTTSHELDLTNSLVTLKAFKKILPLITRIVSKKGKILINLEDKVLLAKRKNILKQLIIYEKWPHGIISNFKRLGKHSNKLKVKRIPSFVIYSVKDPNMLVSINTELKKARISHAAIVNTKIPSNTNMYVIPGNTTSHISLKLYRDLIFKAIIAGYQKEIFFFKANKKKEN